MSIVTEAGGDLMSCSRTYALRSRQYQTKLPNYTKTTTPFLDKATIWYDHGHADIILTRQTGITDVMHTVISLKYELPAIQRLLVCIVSLF